MPSYSIVNLGQNARLQGRITHARGSAKNVHEFLGIPYAKPPIGDLRFKYPQPLPLWSGTRDALTYGPVCPQVFGHIAKRTVGSYSKPEMNEDCLFLNVWTPNPDPEHKLPVMMWIHGGGFTLGFSNIYEGTALAANQDVVFVSINYRLGLLGFLCLEDEHAPGNMGLMDQRAAMKWIQENIKAFGGDPNNVTILGESAGGISVSLHTVSQLSRGLFHKGISQSGVATGNLFLWSPKNAKKHALKHFQGMGFNGTTSADVLKWIDSQGPAALVEKLGHQFYMYPVLDNHFITDTAVRLYERGEFSAVPTMMGFSSHEGAIFMDLMLSGPHSVPDIKTGKAIIHNYINAMFFGEKNVAKVFEAAWSLYVGRETSLQNVTHAMAHIVGDLFFVSGTVKIAKLHSAEAPCYVYQLEYRSVMSSYKTQPWCKADHLDEIPFMMGEAFFPRTRDSWPQRERDFSKLMMSYWANFARNGNPNGPGLLEWKPYSSSSEHLMNLKPEPELAQHHNADKMHFWNDIVPKILQGTYRGSHL